MRAADLVPLIKKSKKTETGYIGLCPAHDDKKRPSLTWADENEKIVIHCHVGCTFDAIAAALELQKKDFFHENPNSAKTISQTNPKSTKTISQTYDYLDENSNFLFQVVRWEPKGFSQRQKNAKSGRWINNLQGVRRVLYRLPELRDRPTVYLCEGEKDVDRLWELGLAATTAPQGAGKWKEEYVEQLKSAGVKNIAIIPDNDKVGKSSAVQISNSLFTQFKTKIIYLPKLQNAGDVSDWLDNGGDRKKLTTLAAEAPLVLTKQEPPPEREEKAKLPEHGVALQMGMRGPNNNVTNAERVLTEGAPYKGRVWFDEFFNRVFIKCGKEPIREWEDGDEIEVMTDIQTTYGIPHMKSSFVHQAMRKVASKNRRNAPADWMNSLRWDKTERLMRFFNLAFGAEHNEYHSCAGRNFLLAMVARTFRPGCKVDTLPVFEGKQGSLKSSALEAITGKEWFAETSEPPDRKDFILALEGKLCVEICELDSFRKAEITTIKAMLSRSTDRFRLPYSRAAQDFPRRSVFAATTNHSDWQADETGARRFHPITCGEIDLEYIRDEREQLFAEAVHEFKAGGKWWEMPGDSTLERQDRSRTTDPWEKPVMEWLDQNPMIENITTDDIMRECLRIDISAFKKSDQMRVAAILRGQGYESKRATVRGARLTRWFR